MIAFANIIGVKENRPCSHDGDVRIQYRIFCHFLQGFSSLYVI